jgi:predicted AAA+ superfamily ATPase
VVGHRGTGKTSLVEALLFQTGKNTGTATLLENAARDRHQLAGLHIDQ